MMIGCSYDTSAVVEKVIKYDCPSEKYCDGQKLYTCHENGYSIRNCTLGCDAKTKACILEENWECDNSTICDEQNDKIIKRCGSDHKYSITEKCPDDTICKNNECFSSSAGCRDNNSICVDRKTIKKCINGQWGVPTPCEDPTPICKNIGDTELGECAPEVVECEQGTMTCSNTDTNPNTYKCGDSSEEQSCDINTPICIGKPGAAKCVECKENETQCIEESSPIKKTCMNNKWQTEECPEGQVCNPAHTDCVGKSTEEKCEQGTKKCVDVNTFQECNDEGNYNEEKPCPEKNPVCVDKDGHPECKECENGKTKCNSDNTASMTCINDHWNTIKCSVYTPFCFEESGKAECKPPICNIGDFRCDPQSKTEPDTEQKLQYCNGTKWQDVVICNSNSSNEKYCNSDYRACLKADLNNEISEVMQTKCIDETQINVCTQPIPAGSSDTCPEDKWQSIATCPDGYQCNEITDMNMAICEPQK